MPKQMQNDRDIYWEDVVTSRTTELIGKIVIVTGGTKGIGRAVVENFLQNGAVVVAVSRHAGTPINNPNYHFKSCDVRDYKRVQQVVVETVSELGALDILVNCAGYAFLTNIVDESEELFDTIMDINFKGVRNFIVASAPYLVPSNGAIVSLGSIWGMPGTNLVGDSTYSAGDAAIIKYSEVAAEELKELRINCISPALVNTSMNDDMTPEARAEFAANYVGRDTLFEPSEIAVVVETLVCLPLTQKNIIVDAGYTRRDI